MHKHAVLILKGGSIIAFGVNHGTVHAEVAALKKVDPIKRKGVKVISIRVRRTGELGLAKPCFECEKFLRENGIRSVMFSKNDGSFETIRF